MSSPTPTSVIDTFFGWDSDNEIYYPRFALRVEQWDEAVRRYPAKDKRFVFNLIRTIANQQDQKVNEPLPRLYNWQWIVAYAEDRLANFKFG